MSFLISGRFLKTGNIGFKEWLYSEGGTQDSIDLWVDSKVVIEFKLDGNTLTKTRIINDNIDNPYTSVYTLGQELDESTYSSNVKNLPLVEGNILTIISKWDNSVATTRIHNFTEDGLEILHKSVKSGNAMLFFKRL